MEGQLINESGWESEGESERERIEKCLGGGDGEGSVDRTVHTLYCKYCVFH